MLQRVPPLRSALAPPPPWDLTSEGSGGHTACGFSQLGAVEKHGGWRQTGQLAAALPERLWLKFNSTPTVDGGAFPSLPPPLTFVLIILCLAGVWRGEFLTSWKPQSGLFWIEGEA